MAILIILASFLWGFSPSSSSNMWCVCGCVYAQMQYSFIYQALLEYYLYGDTELDVSSLEGHLDKLHNTSAPQDRLGLEEEFRVSTILYLCKGGGTET